MAMLATRCFESCSPPASTLSAPTSTEPPASDWTAPRSNPTPRAAPTRIRKSCELDSSLQNKKSPDRHVVHGRSGLFFDQIMRCSQAYAVSRLKSLIVRALLAQNLRPLVIV